MKMQKKLSNGSYVDVSPEYQINLLNAAIAFDQKYPDTYRGKLGLASVEDAIKYLEQGRELRFGSDWYNQIRDNEAHERQLAAARTKRDNDPNYSDTGRSKKMSQITELIQEHGNSKTAVEAIAQLFGVSISEAGDLMTPHFTEMKPIYSIRTGEISGYALTNVRVSRHRQFCVANETLAMFDSPHECYMYLMNGYRSKLLPRSGGGEGRPLPTRAIELYERNKELNERHWVWIQAQGWEVRQCTGYDSVWGYGYYTDDGFVIVDNNDIPVFRVGVQQK